MDKKKNIDLISGEWFDQLLTRSRAILSSQFPFCTEEDVILPSRRFEIGD